MLGAVNHIWDQVSSLGVNANTTSQSIRTIQTLNRVSLIAGLLVAPFIFPSINPTSSGLGWVELGTMIGFFGVLAVNAGGFTRLAPPILILTALFKIFFSASIRGVYAGEQLFFIPLLVGLILMYDIRTSKTGWLMWTLVFLTGLLLNLSEYQLLAPGSPFPEEAIRQIFSVNFTITLVIILAIAFHYSNLTSRQHHEILDARDKAEAASNAKTAFLSVISHELRTPIHAIMNYADMLEDESLTVVQQENLQALRMSSGNLADTVNHILHVVDSGAETKLPQVLVSFSADEPAKQAALLLKKQANRKNLAIQISCDPGPTEVIADRDRIRKVLINLVDNAVKFTKNGTVEIRCRRMDHPDKKQKITLRYEISDTGIGIPQQQIEQMFQPFVLGDSSNVRSANGIGLGLTICKSLIHSMGGQISVSSTPGKGSTFYVEIPAEIGALHQATQSTMNSSEQPAHTALLEILIVDDHPVNQKVASTMIRKLGHHYQLAADGQEAVEKCQSDKFQLVFMDIQMPVMDGIEATKQIRSILPSEQQPIIIALTANTTDRDREACFQAGMNDFMAKPVTKSSIKKKIDEWMKEVPELN